MSTLITDSHRYVSPRNIWSCSCILNIDIFDIYWICKGVLYYIVFEYERLIFIWLFTLNVNIQLYIILLEIVPQY